MQSEQTSQAPVDLARVALRRMATAGLPPTPENYTAEYRKAAGLPPDGPAAAPPASVSAEEKEKAAVQAAEMLQGIMQMLTDTTTGLASGIDQFGDETRKVLSGVEAIRDQQDVRTVMQALTVSALTLQEAVDTSRKELAETKQRLEKVDTELRQTQQLARTDPLTGFINRRGMDEIIEREVARSRRDKAPVCLALLDIDHFKKINDEHGHDVGDRALVHLAMVAKSGVRESDLVCRYGGEEFVVVLPGSEAAGAHFVIDRLRVMIEKTPMMFPGGRLTIRFSAGVTEVTSDDTAETLIKRADKALYDAKRNGRNRVVLAAAA